jgi:hypothetical protein
MNRLLLSVPAILAGVAVAGSANATFLVSYEGEAAGVENTTATFSYSAVETFDSLPTGTYPASIVQTFTDTAHPATTITADYTGPNGVQINPADQYGGAGGTGNYIVAFGSTPYTLNVSSTDLVGGVNYFGYWLSALDSGNQAQFYGANGDLLFTFKPQDVLNAVTRNLNSGEYYGNPDAPNAGADAAQPYIFLNFFDTTGSFSKIVFQEIPSSDGGYESDNHTFGHYTGFGQGTVIPLTLSTQGVPEPATWTMMLLGAAGLGALARRRRAAAVSA